MMNDCDVELDALKPSEMRAYYIPSMSTSIFLLFSITYLTDTSSSQYVFTISESPSGTVIMYFSPLAVVILTFPRLSAADKTPIIFLSALTDNLSLSLVPTTTPAFFNK